MYDPFDAQIRKNLRDIGEEQRVGRQDHHIFRFQCFLISIEQVSDPVQGDGGFSASRGTLYQQVCGERMTDDDVLLRLDGGYDLTEPVRGDTAQDLLKIGFLGNNAAVEQTDKFPLPDGQHSLQGQLALHVSVRRLIVHFSDLAGVIQVRNGGAPVHHNRSQRSRIQNAPASQIPGFRRAAGGSEIQPGKVGLPGGHGQLTQPVQFGLEQLEVYLLLIVRYNVCMHIHFLAGLCPGEGFHFPDFPVNGVPSLLKMKILFLRRWMFG